jgi:hypothetical protein
MSETTKKKVNAKILGESNEQNMSETLSLQPEISNSENKIIKLFGLKRNDGIEYEAFEVSIQDEKVVGVELIAKDVIAIVNAKLQKRMQENAQQSRRTE